MHDLKFRNVPMASNHFARTLRTRDDRSWNIETLADCDMVSDESIRSRVRMIGPVS